jgi:hypothetical protein
MREYNWQVSSGGSITSGEGTNTIVVFWGNVGEQTVKVTYTNQSGWCGSLSSIAVDVSSTPVAARTVTGPASVCQGSTGVSFSVSEIASATGYTWSLPSGAVIVSGGNTSSIVVDLSMSTVQGVVTVYGTNSCGRGAVSPALNLTINPIPVTPYIGVEGMNLVSSAGSGNQWYYSVDQEGAVSMIGGATAGNFQPVESGWYRTQVTLSSCVSAISKAVYRLKQGEPDRFGIYPVPNNGEFTVDITTSQEQEFVIQVFDQLGQKIYELPALLVNGELKQSISLGNVSAGIYSVVIRSKSGNMVMKKFNVFK